MGNCKRKAETESGNGRQSICMQKNCMVMYDRMGITTEGVVERSLD